MQNQKKATYIFIKIHNTFTLLFITNSAQFMKKTLLTVLAFACLSVTTMAQGPTLTASTSTPVLGETFMNQVAQTGNLPSYAGGANQTWNYSALIDSSIAAGVQVLLPSATPYAALFTNSNLAIQTSNNANVVYFNSQASQLSIVGIYAADTGQITYTTPRIYLPYPFSYNSFYTDSVVGEVASYGVIFRGKDSLNADGYGTLNLPNGKTYTNVLRVQYIENVTTVKDTTASIGGLPVSGTFTANLRTVSYLYFTPGTHVPLLTVNATTTSAYITAFGITNPVNGYPVTLLSATYLTASALPVTFTSFTASLQNKNVLLNWKTAQETNTDHFNVQRSLTGIDFATVDAVSATGNGTGSTYNYNDQTYAKTNVPPSVYYRIQEVDKDGKLFYSGTALIHGSQSIISLYPNPAGSFIRFSIPNATVADAVVIYDAKGRAVKQWSHYSLTQPAAIEGLSKGTYFIQIKINNKTTTTTFVKE